MIRKKALKDLWAVKAKALLVLVAMIIGIFGLSTILYTYSISKRDLRDNYLRTEPASAIVKIENLTIELFDSLAQLNYIDEVEIREQVVLRARSNSGFNWMPLYVFGVTDFADVRLNRFTLEEGRYPAKNEVLIERDGIRFLDGKDLHIQIDGAEEAVLRQSGTVHDPGLMPSHMDHLLYAYVTMPTFNRYFRSDNSSQLLVRFSEHNYDYKAIQNFTYQLIDFISKTGGKVNKYIIRPPGEHPHQGQLASLLFLQAGLGGLAVLLSMLLLINVIVLVMNEQIKQIGIMKATGASYSQLLRMYMTGIAVLTIAAIAIGLPLGYKTSLAYNYFIAEELNFDVINTRIPFGIHVLLILSGFLITFAATYFPIAGTSRISIKEALEQENIKSSERPSAFSRGNRYFFPFWLTIASQNTFRKRSRLILLIMNLMLGLAMFAVGLNVSSSLDNTFQHNMGRKQYDFSVRLNKAYPDSSVRKHLRPISQIKYMEIWGAVEASFIGYDSTAKDVFTIVAFDDSTDMWHMEPTQGGVPGSWQKNAMVVNPEFIDRYPQTKAGDSVTIVVDEQISTWYIAAIIKDIGAATAYTSLSSLRNKTNNGAIQTDLKVRTKPSALMLDKTILDIENTLSQAGIYIHSSLNQSTFLTVLRDHIGVIMTFLLAMAVLVLIVGGLGIVSIMNISLMDRKREIGIMRAIGASKRQISLIIMVEMVLFGLISWLIGWCVSYPLSKWVSNFFGQLILDTNLDFALNPNSLMATFWVMCTVLLLSAIIPLWNAMRMPVHDALTQ